MAICPECGSEFAPKHHRARFCSPAHQRAFHDLMAMRGKALLPLALVWRGSKRGSTASASYALAQLATLLDRYREEDRKAGRQPDLIVKAKLEEKWTAADLTNQKRPRRSSFSSSAPADTHSPAAPS